MQVTLLSMSLLIKGTYFFSAPFAGTHFYPPRPLGREGGAAPVRVRTNFLRTDATTLVATARPVVHPGVSIPKPPVPFF